MIPTSEHQPPPLLRPVGETFWWSTEILRLIGAYNEGDHLVIYGGTEWEQHWQWTGQIWCNICRFVRVA